MAGPDPAIQTHASSSAPHSNSPEIPPTLRYDKLHRNHEARLRSGTKMRIRPFYPVEVPTQTDVEFWLLLLLYRKGRPAKTKEMYDLLAEHFKLTAQQRLAVMEHTEENAWENRVRQARRHLVNMKWIYKPRPEIERGLWKLTELGHCEGKRLDDLSNLSRQQLLG